MINNIMKGAVVVFSILFLLPTVSFAQVVISEIMYDLEGADSGREWIEIYNNGNSDVDLTGWRFFEGGTNHKLKLVQGDIVISSGGYIVITDNSDKFLADWPGFSKTIFDSSFSLKNIGESITIRNSDLVDIDSVTYSSEWGASGDSNSLQLANGSFIPASPTPGKANANSGSGSSGEDSGGETSTGSSSSSGGVLVPTLSISAYAGNDRIVIVGADSVFDGYAYGLNGEPLLNARYTWNFGNGQRKEGQKILHHYLYPGEYVVSLDVSSGEYSAFDRMIVTAEPAQILISSATSEFVEIKNESKHELDISFWYLKTDEKLFLIPESTILLSEKSVKFSSSITGIIASNGDVNLLYPNGNLATSYDISSIEYVSENQELSTQFVFSENPEVERYTAVVEGALENKMSDSNILTLAAVENAEDNSNSIYKWLFALTGIIGAGVVAVMVRRKGSISDEIKILE